MGRRWSMSHQMIQILTDRQDVRLLEAINKHFLTGGVPDMILSRTARFSRHMNQNENMWNKGTVNVFWAVTSVTLGGG